MLSSCQSKRVALWVTLSTLLTLESLNAIAASEGNETVNRVFLDCSGLRIAHHEFAGYAQRERKGTRGIDIGANVALCEGMSTYLKESVFGFDLPADAELIVSVGNSPLVPREEFLFGSFSEDECKAMKASGYAGPRSYTDCEYSLSWQPFVNLLPILVEPATSAAWEEMKTTGITPVEPDKQTLRLDLSFIDRAGSNERGLLLRVGRYEVTDALERIGYGSGVIERCQPCTNTVYGDRGKSILTQIKRSLPDE